RPPLAQRRRALSGLRRLPGEDEPHDPARAPRAPLACAAGRAVVAAAEAREEIGEDAELSLGVVRGEGPPDALDVEVARLAQLLVARVGEDRVGHPRVGVAVALADPAGAFEAVEQARDPGRRQQHLVREVDATHGALLRM